MLEIDLSEEKARELDFSAGSISKPRDKDENKRRPIDLEGKNIVVYDLEIIKTIPQCSKGWESFDEMGISVGCAFDYRTMRYRVFMADNIQELVDRLNEENTLVVAFNNVGFDNKLVRGSGLNLKDDALLRNFDMLLVSKQAAGCADKKFVKGFKLDDHLASLNLPRKTGDGALAPVLWQEGKIGAVVDYCLNDVYAEKSLFEWMYVTRETACAYEDGRRFEILEGFPYSGASFNTFSCSHMTKSFPQTAYF